MMKDSSDPSARDTKQTTSSARSAIQTKESYHVAFSHVLALLIITTIQQLFSNLSLIFLKDNFPDFYDAYYSPKISLLQILMIIDLGLIFVSFVFSGFLAKINGSRIWLAVFLIFLSGLSLFFNIYEIFIIIGYTNKFDRIPMALGFFLRLMLIVVESVFLILKVKLARGDGESSVALLGNINISEEMHHSQGSLFKDRKDLTYFVLLMDFLKMEILCALIIAILFLFFLFGDGSSEIVMGEVFAWLDFIFVVLGFFVYIYSQINPKIIKFALTIVWFSIGTIIMSYMLTYLSSSYYGHYDEKMLNGYGIIGLSSTLRGFILLMSLLHYTKKRNN